MQTLYLQGKPIKLGEFLGEGKFKVVYADPDPQSPHVYAIFKPVADPREELLNEQKVLAICSFSLPSDSFYGPEKPLFTTAKSGKVGGFRTFRYPSNTQAFQLLSDTATWNGLQLNQAAVSKALLSLCTDIVRPLHGINARYGDFSANNVGFIPNTNKAVGYDLDAAQFDWNGTILPCQAGTPEFLAPRLLNGATDNFTVADDLWALSIIIGQSLLRLYPYREGDTGELEVINRINKQLHVLNPDLRYPPTRVANPLTSLPTRFLAFLKQIYDARECKATIEDFIRELTLLNEEWQVCTNHPYPLVYAKERTQCPHCLRDRTVPTITLIVVTNAGIKFISIYLPLPRIIVYSKVTKIDRKDTFFTVYLHANKLYCEWINNEGTVVKNIPVDIPLLPNTKFDVNETHVMVAQGNEVKLYGIESAKIEHTLRTQQYQNRPLASVGREFPIVLDGVSLSKGKNVFGRMYPDLIMPLTSANSVWFTAEGVAGSHEADSIVGFTNMWGSYQWFVHQGKFTLLPVVKTQASEVMLDWQVVFDGKGFAIIRWMQGSTSQSTTYVDVFNGTDHQFSNTLPTKIQGKAVMSIAKGSLFVPTEEGIRKITKDTSTVLTGSENISPAAHLHILGGHLYILDESTGQLAKVAANK